MARKNPHDPEEGIIELFEIVDDPKPFPEEVHYGNVGPAQPAASDSASVGSPDTPDGMDAASENERLSDNEGLPEQARLSEEVVEELTSSRYPFENSEEFLDAGAPVSGEAEPAVPNSGAFAVEKPEEALVRVFEAEMARAGAAVSAKEPEQASPEQRDSEQSESAQASGLEADAEAESMPERLPENEFEGKEGDEAVASLPEEETPCHEDGAPDAQAVGEAVPADEVPKDAPAGDETFHTQDVPTDGETEDKGSLPVLNMFDERSVPAGQPDLGSGTGEAVPFEAAGAAACAENTGATEPTGGSPDGSEVEERLIRLEEALSRLNERVVDLERRVESSEEQKPVLSALTGDMQSLLTEGNALCGELKSLAKTFEQPVAEQSEPPFVDEDTQKHVVPEAETGDATADFADDEPDINIRALAEEGEDVFGLALEALEQRVCHLEQRPVQASADTAGIAQDVLALVRVDMEKNVEEQDAVARVVDQLQHRVSDLEARPLPQLILPELPDAEAITADVMARIQKEVDRVAAEAAARVLREEIADLMQKDQ